MSKNIQKENLNQNLSACGVKYDPQNYLLTLARITSELNKKVYKPISVNYHLRSNEYHLLNFQ